MGKRKANATFLKAGEEWRKHLADYRKAHPNMPMKEAMKAAKKTYKKSGVSKFKNSRYSIRIRPRTRNTKRVNKTKRPKNKRPKTRRAKKSLLSRLF